MMKILSFTATSVAMVALQGCKSSTDMSKLTKTAKDANAKITGDDKKAADFDAPIKAFENDVKKVTEQSKDLKESKKKEWTDLKVKDVCTNLTAMNTQFTKALKDPADAKTLFDRYTKAVAGQWKFFEYSKTCTSTPVPTPTPSNIQKQLDERDRVVAALQAAAAKTGVTADDKKTYEDQIAILQKLNKDTPLADLKQKIGDAREALPQSDKDQLTLETLKKQIPGLITQLEELKKGDETKTLIADLTAAKELDVQKLKAVKKAVTAAKKYLADVAEVAAMKVAYDAFVATLTDATDQALETARVAALTDGDSVEDKKLKEYQAMKAAFKAKPENKTKDFTKDDAVIAYKAKFAAYKAAEAEVKQANDAFTADMETYKTELGDDVKTLNSGWESTSNADKTAQHKIIKSLKEGKKTENVLQADGTTTVVPATAEETVQKTNVVAAYKAIAAKIVLDEAEKQHTKDIEGATDAVGLNAAQVVDEKFRWGKLSNAEKVAEMKALEGKTAAEKKPLYEGKIDAAKTVHKTAYATEVDAGVDADVNTVAFADIRTQAKALFDALTLEEMDNQSTELKTATDGKQNQDLKDAQQKFVLEKLAEAADAQHNKDVTADPAIFTTADLLDNEKYRWTSIVDKLAADAKTNDKMKFYVDRKAVADEQPATIDAFYVILVNDAIAVVDGQHTTANTNGAIVDAANQNVDGEWWATVTTLEAKKTFMDLVAAAADDADRKTLFDAKFDEFVKKWHTETIVVAGNGDLTPDEKIVETARFASLNEADKIAFWTAQRNNALDAVSNACKALFPAFIDAQHIAKLAVDPVITAAEGSAVEAARWAGLAAGAKLTDFVAFHNLDNQVTEDLKNWFITKIGEHLATVKPAFTAFVAALTDNNGVAATDTPAEVDDADKLAAYKLVLTTGYDAATTTAGAKWDFEAAADGDAKNAYVRVLHSDFEFTRIINLQADNTIGAPNNLVAVVAVAGEKTRIDGVWGALAADRKRAIALDLERIEAGTDIADIDDSAGDATGIGIPVVADIAIPAGKKAVRDNLAAAFVAVFHA